MFSACHCNIVDECGTSSLDKGDRFVIFRFLKFKKKLSAALHGSHFVRSNFSTMLFIPNFYQTNELLSN